MVDTAQVIYEHSAGSTLSFFTNNLSITIKRPTLSVDVRPDGTKLVTDSAAYQRIFQCTGVLTGANAKILHDWLIGAITYSGDYPRLTTVTFASGQTITNIEVAITACRLTDLGAGMWQAEMEFTEKSA